MINETILAIIIAFAISAMLCPVVIPFLHKLKFGQQVRDDGPQAHLKKQGTPTMGGLVILTSIVITSLFYIRDYPKIIPVLFVTVGFGIVGFLDDYIKIVMKRSEGLNPLQKLIGQFIITGIFAWYLLHSGQVETTMLIPFTGGFDDGIFISLGILFVPFLFFVVLGTDNGVNFTDGLDGLCTSVTILVAEGSMIPVEGDTVVAHLDKSHVTVHTYPEYHPDTCLATFRVDIDVATCGEITPLSTLDYLIGSFDSDIITMDYRVRGFTRDIEGKKLFMDHHMTSIQDFIDPKTLERYDAYDINVYQSNLFHTRMLLKEVDLQNYLFNTDIYELPPKTRLKIHSDLRREMIEIFSGKNIY